MFQMNDYYFQKKMAYKHRLYQRLKCVRRDIFKSWEASANICDNTMARKGNLPPVCKFTPTNSYYDMAENRQQQQQNQNMYRQANSPPSPAPPGYFDVINTSRDRYGFSRTVPPQSTAIGQLPNYHESFGSQIPREVPSNDRPPRCYSSGVGYRPSQTSGPMTDTSQRYDRRAPQAGFDRPSNRSFQLSQDRSMDRYGFSRTMPGHSTAIGELPIGRDPPCQRVQDTSRDRFGFSRVMPAESTAIRPNISREVPDRFQLSSRFFEADVTPQFGEIRNEISSTIRSNDIRDYSTVAPSDICDMEPVPLPCKAPQSGGARGYSTSPHFQGRLVAGSTPRKCSLVQECPMPPETSECAIGADESFMETFDRSVEKELERYRTNGPADTSLNMSIPVPRGLSDSRVLDSATSSVEILSRMKGDQDTELTDAVEKLAKAEATVMFQGAIQAAEQAAANAPPEYAEEAAAAGARAHTQIYNAELTNVVHESVPGLRPIEIVGYVGVTRPKKPKKS